MLGKPAEGAPKETYEARATPHQAEDTKVRTFDVVEVMEPDVDLIPGKHYERTVASYVN